MGLNVDVFLVCIFHDNYMGIEFIFAGCLNKANQYRKLQNAIAILDYRAFVAFCFALGKSLLSFVSGCSCESLQCLKKLITLVCFVFHY